MTTGSQPYSKGGVVVMRMITKALGASILLLIFLCCQVFAGKEWRADAIEFQIGITRWPLLEIPHEVPVDIQAGTRSAKDATKEERIAWGAELGNAAFEYVREHQYTRLWYTADIAPVSGRLDDMLVWPDSQHVAIVLKDGTKVFALEAIAMMNCGARMSGCHLVHVYPQQQPFTFGTIYIDDVGQCLLLVGFPTTFDPSDAADLIFAPYIQPRDGDGRCDNLGRRSP